MPSATAGAEWALMAFAALHVSVKGRLAFCEKVRSIPKYGHYHASWRHCWELRLTFSPFALPGAMAAGIVSRYKTGLRLETYS